VGNNLVQKIANAILAHYVSVDSGADSWTTGWDPACTNFTLQPQRWSRGNQSGSSTGFI